MVYTLVRPLEREYREWVEGDGVMAGIYYQALDKPFISKKEDPR